MTGTGIDRHTLLKNTAKTKKNVINLLFVKDTAIIFNTSNT